jgi:hypothetical protein
MIRPNKLECYITLGWKRLKWINATLLGLFISYEEKDVMRIQYLSLIHNALFSSSLMVGPNKLECYITLGWKGLKWTNTTLLGPFVSYEEKEVMRIQYLSLIHNALFSSSLMVGPNKPECYITLGWKGLKWTNTSLLGPFVSYEENEVMRIQYLSCIHNT